MLSLFKDIQEDTLKHYKDSILLVGISLFIFLSHVGINASLYVFIFSACLGIYMEGFVVYGTQCALVTVCEFILFGARRDSTNVLQAFSTLTVFPGYYTAAPTIMPYCFLCVCVYVCVGVRVCPFTGTMALCPMGIEADVKAVLHFTRDRRQMG